MTNEQKQDIKRMELEIKNDPELQKLIQETVDEHNRSKNKWYKRLLRKLGFKIY